VLVEDVENKMKVLIKERESMLGKRKNAENRLEMYGEVA
jgi:hypothetical protein